MNLRWSWHPETRDLFAAVDPQIWQEVEHDPTRLLGAVSTERPCAESPVEAYPSERCSRT